VGAEGVGAEGVVGGALTARPKGGAGRVRLCEAASAEVRGTDACDLQDVWSEDTTEFVFAQVVGGIDRTVSRVMQRRAMGAEQNDMAFQHQLWRGRWHLAQLTKEDSDAALGYFQRALYQKSNEPEALIQMAFWHLWRTWVSRDGEAGLSAAESFARKAMALDADDGRVYAALGIADAWRRKHESAIIKLERAIDLNPSLDIAHHQLGSALNHADTPEQAITPLLQAMRYSPRDQLDFAFQTEMAVALARTEEFEEAYVRASRALIMKPRYWYGHLVRLLAADRLGDRDRLAEAEEAVHAAGFRVTERQIDWLPFRSSDWPDQLRRLVK